MDYRSRIEEIMEKANLSKEEKDLLIEVFDSYVLSKNAIAALQDKRVFEIVNKINMNGQGNELQKLMGNKEGFIDTNPCDMINDDLSMIH